MIFNFEHSYKKLPKEFYSVVSPADVQDPSLVIFNDELAKELEVNVQSVSKKELANYFSGKKLMEGSQPIAQAYAGHQFGGFTNLGDGRAILLGEHVLQNKQRFDIQLKGSGRTPYSRNGDGKARLSAMLREYLISESIHALGIPTTRSLAVVSTGEEVVRNDVFPGAVLTRIASSHIRVGTFQFAAFMLSEDKLEALFNYTLQRHYPELIAAENKAIVLLEKVMLKQTELIVNWLRVGFIHGVMNTDNMSISGETIDYGPCAFMNSYDPKTVYSSIDTHGRYAFGKQPEIVYWNISRFAEALLPLIDQDKNLAIEKAKSTLASFSEHFNTSWLKMMGKKLGINDVQEKDAELIQELLSLMEQFKADYTNTFAQLSGAKIEAPIFEQEDFKAWKSIWLERIGGEEALELSQKNSMQKSNPVFIPRNHKVEYALAEAEQNGNLRAFNELLAVMKKAYDYTATNETFQKVPEDFDSHYQTFCGT